MSPLAMAAFDQRGLGAHGEQRMAGGDSLGVGPTGRPVSLAASGRLGVTMVARGSSCSRSAAMAPSGSSTAPEVATITGSSTIGRLSGSAGGDRADDVRIGQHAELDRVRADIGEHGFDGEPHEFGRQ